jgi:hypothetical protein
MARSKKSVIPYSGKQLELPIIAESIDSPLFTNSGGQDFPEQPPPLTPNEGSGEIQLVNKSPLYVRGDRKEGHSIYVISIKSRGYFRYDAWIGHKKIYSIHIPGGSVDSSLAQSRALSVVEAMRLGKHRDAIAVMIRSWPRQKHKVGDGKR